MQHDGDGNIWIMVHSGSRNIGSQLCEYYDSLAETFCKTWYSVSTVPFLPANSQDGKDYLKWLQFTSAFAYLSRKIMLDDVIKNIEHYFPGLKITTNEHQALNNVRDGLINIHHNYAAIEHHMGKNWWVHRKGATLASTGTIGLVPGSQSTDSFVTIGLGNVQSLNSCSHGAGRKCGRKDFNIKNQSRKQEIEDAMTNKGIVFTEFSKVKRGRDEGMFDLSEAGDAYKDIASVMESQKDLVNPIIKLTAIVSWKG